MNYSIENEVQISWSDWIVPNIDANIPSTILRISNINWKYVLLSFIEVCKTKSKIGGNINDNAAPLDAPAKETNIPTFGTKVEINDVIRTNEILIVSRGIGNFHFGVVELVSNKWFWLLNICVSWEFKSSFNLESSIAELFWSFPSNFTSGDCSSINESSILFIEFEDVENKF